jgi:hypothetical protein
MPTIRILSASLLAASLLAQPVMAQNKASVAKSVNEFTALSQGLAASLADLSKRAETASPNDKEMIKLVTTQLGIVDATADGVVALGMVAARMRDNSDLAVAKTQLGTRCAALKTLADASTKYVGSLASNIAAVATAAEVKKARDLVQQMSQHELCSAGKA